MGPGTQDVPINLFLTSQLHLWDTGCVLQGQHTLNVPMSFPAHKLGENQQTMLAVLELFKVWANAVFDATHKASLFLFS